MKNIFSLLLLSSLSLGACKTTIAKVDNNQSFSNTEKDSVLTRIQKQTFNYFWEGAEPVSGLARERIHIDGVYPENDQNVITIGGSGFGLMSILVGMERGFIQKTEGDARIAQALSYLAKADRFHGAWSHWYYGETGKVKAFSAKDNGADLVETAFMAQALICIREYYKNGNTKQQRLAEQADELWKGIDWDFFRNNKDVLFWHWSPTAGWGMNHAIQGYDECLITYILAASSPTHPIPASTYHIGWARNGAIKTTLEKFGIPTILKHNAKPGEVGPLFWAHYAYLGLNPFGLVDRYADYAKVTQNHVKINLAYAAANTLQVKGYGPQAGWGWTASYSVNGYDAHHPDNDKKVISPTAALASFPYSPTESMAFARYAFQSLGDKVWGKYGFYDAYSEAENWYPQRYLAIDQGPIIVMIENYRSQLLWNLFMNAPDVQAGLKKLEFTSPYFK